MVVDEWPGSFNVAGFTDTEQIQILLRGPLASSDKYWDCEPAQNEKERKGKMKQYMSQYL